MTSKTATKDFPVANIGSAKSKTLFSIDGLQNTLPQFLNFYLGLGDDDMQI